MIKDHESMKKFKPEDFSDATPSAAVVSRVKDKL